MQCLILYPLPAADKDSQEINRTRRQLCTENVIKVQSGITHGIYKHITANESYQFEIYKKKVIYK